MKKTVWIGKIPLYLFMLVLSVCALLPFYMMIVMGTHYSEDLYTGVKLFFGKYFVENFHAVMRLNFLLMLQYHRRSAGQRSGRLCICKI